MLDSLWGCARKLVRRLRRPRVLRKLVFVKHMEPRISAADQDQQVLSFQGTDEEIQQQMAVNARGLFSDIEPEHRVLIKINLNTSAHYPASTDPDFLVSMIDLLHRKGIEHILVGDCSSNPALPTRKVFEQSGIAWMIQGKAEMVCFDEGEWVAVSIAGQYLNQVVVPKILYDVDRIIYLANVKTHREADFSMAMKHSVGFMHPLQRYNLHRDHLQEKSVELSLAVRPDWIILDGRQIMITGGPNSGDIRAAGLVFAGRNLLCVDLAAYRLLYQLKVAAHCVDSFEEDPYAMRQFRHADRIFNGERLP